jgi:hypothetical protein
MERKTFAKQSEQNGVVGEIELKYRTGSRPLSRKRGAIGPIDAQSVFVPAPYWQPPNFAQTEPELANRLNTLLNEATA